MCLCHCTLWGSFWACNKEQFFCWGVQQIARRGLCVSFSFLLCAMWVCLCVWVHFVCLVFLFRFVFAHDVPEIATDCFWWLARSNMETMEIWRGCSGTRALRMCIVSFFRCIVHRACRCALCHYLDAISTCSGCIYSRRCCCNARWDCAFNRMAQFDAWWFCTIYLLSRHRWHSGWYTADATNRIHTNSPRAVDCWLVQPFLKGGHFWRGPPRWHKMIAPLLFWWRSYLKRCAVACLQLTGGGEGRSQLKTLLKSQLHLDLGSTHGKRNTTGQNQKALIWY